MLRKLISRIFPKKPDFKSLVKSGAIIVDVRTKGEFETGGVKGSINIPLDTISSKIESLKKKQKPVITVCRSGARSGSAKKILQHHGLEVYNGGPWNLLEHRLR